MVHQKLPKEVQQRMAELTEKYHLVNTETGISVNYNEWQFTIIDFSDPENIKLITFYENQRKILNGIIQIISFILSDKFEENIKQLKTQSTMIKECTSQVLSITNTIFTTLFQIGWNRLPHGKYFEDILPSKEDPPKLIRILFDLLMCIDIAIYIGLKKLNNNDNENKDEVKYDLYNLNTIGNA